MTHQPNENESEVLAWVEDASAGSRLGYFYQNAHIKSLSS
jgi:hypothetical protein